MTTNHSTHTAGINRRTFLADASFAALGSQAMRLAALTTPASAVVRTPSGSLRGESADAVRVFRGVPFAEPPVGPLRFLPPVSGRSWSGERDATRFAPSAMQWHESSAPGERPFAHSEDCLYLNIWGPEGKGPFPVFVWIHGGGFVSGHAFDPMYDGTEFARAGIVCVTVAYRLGVFGFLDAGPLLDPTSATDYANNPLRDSANNALRDLIAALEWVQASIAIFGGDPGRVTIGGESAGAKLAGILMGIPSAQPLFHQMISESGGAERVWSQVDAIRVATAFGEQWREQTGKDTASVKTSPPEALIEAQHEFLERYPYHFPLRAEVDGELLPKLPVWTIAKGSTRGKRLLIGTNRDESALFLGPHPGEPAAKNLGNLTLAKFDEVFARYPEVYPDITEFQLRIRAVTAEEYWVPSIRVADAHVEGGGSAWMYRLDFAESSGRLSGFAYHSLDVGLVWDRPHVDAANARAEAVLARQIHLAWAAFIRGETPAAPGLPAWPQYSSATRPTMVLDTQSRVEQAPQQAELRLWEGLL